MYTSPQGRSCRVDIESDTDSNERVIAEIQINPDKRIMIRNLFASSHVFYGASDKGDTSAQMADKLPRIIHINILGYNIREKSTKLVEPFKIMYTEEPKEIAIPNFSGYNIQLPKIKEIKPDFTSDLYCWCYTLYTAHVEEKTVKEVIEMTPALQEYAEKDAGFQQFSDRFNFVSADPKTRKQYVLWAQEQMREAGVREWALEEGLKEGIEKGMEKGIEKGSNQRAISIAAKMLKRNRSLEEIAEDTGLLLEEVEAIQKGLQ